MIYMKYMYVRAFFLYFGHDSLKASRVSRMCTHACTHTVIAGQKKFDRNRITRTDLSTKADRNWLIFIWFNLRNGIKFKYLSYNEVHFKAYTHTHASGCVCVGSAFCFHLWWDLCACSWFTHSHEFDTKTDTAHMKHRTNARPKQSHTTNSVEEIISIMTTTIIAITYRRTTDRERCTIRSREVKNNEKRDWYFLVVDTACYSSAVRTLRRL